MRVRVREKASASASARMQICVSNAASRSDEKNYNLLSSRGLRVVSLHQATSESSREYNTSWKQQTVQHLYYTHLPLLPTILVPALRLWVQQVPHDVDALRFHLPVRVIGCECVYACMRVCVCVCV